MYNLFLDDVRQPDWVTLYKNSDKYKDLSWVVVEDYSQFISYIEKKGMPSLISFDHDLADEHYMVTANAIRNGFDIKKDHEEKTGYDALKWLCDYALENEMKLPVIKFHTANYIGLKNMQVYLKNFIKHHPELKT